MSIRLATAADKPVLEALWDYCFEKRTDPFFRFYFDTCWRPEETVLYETDAGLTAAVHLRRYTLSVRGAACPVTYIVGLATHPAARGKGYASQLLRACLAESGRIGRYANILMPSAAAFYLPHGWGMYCHQWRRSFVLRMSPAPAVQGEYHYEWLTAEAATDSLAAVYEKYTADKSGYAIRKAEDWRRWLRGQCAEGNVLCLHEKGEPVGYIAYSIADRTLQAGELIAIRPDARCALLRYIHQHRDSVDRATYYAAWAEEDYLYWPDGAEQIYTRNESFPFMLVRIADIRHWWAQIPAAADGSCHVAVTAPEGRTTWHVQTENGKSHWEESDAEPELTIGIGDLSVLSIGRVDAEDLYQAARLRGDAKAAMRLARMYPRTDTWINEWY